ncbi:hypothetical protein [Alloactinosynnema sp. L-07]|nr:hypothetical protein [Alloactinosynnema sp. L-07]
MHPVSEFTRLVIGVERLPFGADHAPLIVYLKVRAGSWAEWRQNRRRPRQI